MKRFLASPLKALFTVVLAATLLLTSTACSQARDLQAKVKGDAVDVPGQEQPYEGGMNNFSDVNPDRLNTTSAEAKAKALKDTVERRINQKSVNEPSDIVDNVRSSNPGKQFDRVTKGAREGVNDAVDDAKGLVNDTANSADRATKSASRAADQVKANTRDAADDAKRAVDRNT